MKTEISQKATAIGKDVNWMTADDALRQLRSGMRVFVGSGYAAPQSLVGALARRGSGCVDVEIIHILTFGDAKYSRHDLLANFRPNAFFIGPNVREAVHEGVADYTPVFPQRYSRVVPAQTDTSRHCARPSKPAGRTRILQFWCFCGCGESCS